MGLKWFMGAERVADILPKIKENYSPLPTPDYSFAKNIIKASGVVIPLAAGAILVDSIASLQEFGEHIEVFTQITGQGPDIYFIDQTRHEVVNVTKRETNLYNSKLDPTFYPVFIYSWEENGTYHISRFRWIDFWQAMLPDQELLESDTFFTPVVSEDGNQIFFYPRGSRDNYFSLNIRTGNWVEVSLDG